MPKFSAIKCLIVLLLVFIWTVVMTFTFFVSLFIPFFNSQKLPCFFHKGICFLLGIDVQFVGDFSKFKPTLFVSNHISYLDIVVLGQRIPAFFVAKSEVASWPVLNKLAKLQKTVFIERKTNKARKQIQQLRGYFEQEHNLILFPEGTSTNGAEVLPLKSSLFAAAESDKVDVMVQAVSIVYTQYQGKGMNQAQRDSFAWYADMPFGAHFLKVLGLGKVKVVVSFNPSVSIKQYDTRKECALHCGELIQDSFIQAFEASGSVK